MYARRALRVVVLVDWQNAYKTARVAFGLSNEPAERGTISPMGLARSLVAGMRGHGHKLERVELHRGLPDARRDKVGNAAVMRQRDAWLAEDLALIVPKLRPLAYHPETGEPEEKGIDVAIVVSALEWTITGHAQHVIIFSHDSDMKPGIEAVCRLYGADKISTASWWSRDYRKRIPATQGVANITLDEATFLKIETPIDYRPTKTA